MGDDKSTHGKGIKFGSRRARAWVIVLGLVLLGSVIMLSVAQFGRSSTTLEKIGTIADFPPGSVTRIQLKAAFTDVNPRVHMVTASDKSGTIIGVTPMPPQQIAPIIFLVNDPELGVLALYARSPHGSGCWIVWEELRRRFMDPCDGTKYTQTGEVIDGPAPRGLDRFGVSVMNDGEISVNVDDYQQGPSRR